MTDNIFALTTNEENQQALVFEELDDSQADAVVGGAIENDETDAPIFYIRFFIGMRR